MTPANASESQPSSAACFDPPDRAEPVPAESRGSRRICALGAAAWCLVFGLLWLGAPPLPKALGLAWFALGLLWPRGWFVTLALALPWFGNNPGGAHHLYLIDMGMMGLVARHLAERAAGRIAPRRNRLDPWITLFVIYSWITLIPQWPWLKTEFRLPRVLALIQAGGTVGTWAGLKIWWATIAGFLYRICNHYGTADVFGLQMALKMTLSAGAYVALRDRPWPPARLRRFWGLLLAGLLFSALVGWLNYAGWLPLGWWRGENPDITRFGYRRLQSLYWHAGWYAEYLEALAPALVALGWTARRAPVRWSLWALALLLAVTQLFTMQRAGWIGLAGGYATVALLAMLSEPDRGQRRRRLRRLGLTAGGLLFLLAILTLASATLRHRVGALFAFQDRIWIWRASWELLRIHWLVGVGIGNYSHLHQWIFQTGHPYNVLDKVTAHNLFLHLWVERGLIGLGLFAVVLLGAARWLIRPAAESAAPADPGLGDPWRPHRLAIAGALAALLLDGLFQYSFYIRVIEILFWMMVAWAAWGGASAARRVRRRPWTWMGVIAIAIVSLVVVELRTTLTLGFPYQLPIDGVSMNVGEGEVRLPLADSTRRVSIDLGCADSSATPAAPVTFTLSLGGAPLRQVRFTRCGRQSVTLDLPQPASPHRELLITASRVWLPWAFGYRASCPLAAMGVLYTTPREYPPPR